MSQPATAEPAAIGNPWRYAVPLLLLGWGLQTYAIWSRTYVPLVDLPNHMARHYLEAVWLAGGELPAGYAVEYRILPNLGGDLVVPLLMQFLDPLTACKVFLTLAVFLWWVGPALFIRECGGRRPGALLAALLLLPLAFSTQFFWGFLNYYSGLGLAFLALAHYLWLSRQERPSAIQLALHALLVVLLFFWHLAPWAIYGAVMGCHLAVSTLAAPAGGRPLRPRLFRASLFALLTVPSLVLFAFYTLSHFGAETAGRSVWGGWQRKVMALQSVFRTADWKADAVALLCWAGALTGFGVAGRRAGDRWLALAVAVLLALYLLLPATLGTTTEADTRLLPAALVCALAWIGTLPVRRFGLAAALLAACLVVRYGSIVLAWDRLAEQLDAPARSLEHLAPHGRVMPVVLVPEPSPRYPEQHFVAWAVPLRGAFVPTLFAFRDQQPLVIASPCRVYLRRGADGYEVDEAAVRACYDYVWVCNRTGEAVRIPASFTAVFSADGVTVWRVR